MFGRLSYLGKQQNTFYGGALLNNTIFGSSTQSVSRVIF